MGCGNHFRARETILGKDGLPGNFAEIGEKKEKAAELGAKLSDRQLQLLNIRHRGLIWMGMSGPFVVGAAGQAGEALLFENRGNVSSTERVPLVVEDLADVIDGEIPFASLNDLIPPGIGFGGLLGTFGRGQEKGPGGILAELVNEAAKAARGIAKASGGGLGREFVDEEGAQGFVLAVGGIGGMEENFGRIS